MKRNMILTSLVLLGSIIILSSCGLLFDTHSDSDSLFGAFIEIDQFGHVEEKITYSHYDWRKWEDDQYKFKTRRIIFSPDGSYHIAEYLYESSEDDLNENTITGEGEILSFKEWGSYSYDPETYLLIYQRSSYKSYYDESVPYSYTVQPIAYLFPAGSYKKETVILTERTHAKAYVRDNLDWIYTYEDNRSQRDRYQESFKITSGVLSYRYLYREDYIDEDTPGELHAEEVWNVEIINTFPIEGFLSEEPYVQINGIYSSFMQRNWDEGTGAIGDWRDDPYQAVDGPYTKGFYRFDDVLIYDEEILELNRNLF